MCVRVCVRVRVRMCVLVYVCACMRVTLPVKPVHTVLCVTHTSE